MQFRCCTRHLVEFQKEELEHALDNLRDSINPVVGRHRFELYAWRVHTPAAGNRARRVAD